MHIPEPPLELGLGFTIHASVWALELQLGTHNRRFAVAPRVGLRDLQSTLRCGPLSWVSHSQSTLPCGPSIWG